MATYDRGGSAAAGDVVAALFGARGTKALSSAQRAARAWYAANGDRERAHTTGVWLKESRRKGSDPTLVVAVDAPWLAGELGTNKDLYLQRLANRGVRVSDIRFSVGQKPNSHQGSAGARKRVSPAKELRPLTPGEEDRISRATRDLPDGLRQSAARAMGASLRRAKPRDDSPHGPNKA